MKTNRLLPILFTIAPITVNALANILPFNGQTTGEISDRFPIRFVPAGYAFSIWGLIYLGLLGLALFQALPPPIFAMAVLLLALIALYRRLRAANQPGAGFHWCVQLPFSIYLGWISVATIANAAQLLTFLNWDAWGLSPEVWAAIMLAPAATLGLAVLRREGGWAYALVLVWG